MVSRWVRSAPLFENLLGVRDRVLEPHDFQLELVSCAFDGGDEIIGAVDKRFECFLDIGHRLSWD